MSDLVIVALIAAVPGVLASIVAALGLVVSLRNGRKVDAVADGMQSKMLEAQRGETVAVSHAEGLAAGEAKEQARSK